MCSSADVRASWIVYMDSNVAIDSHLCTIYGESRDASTARFKPMHLTTHILALMAFGNLGMDRMLDAILKMVSQD